MAAAARGRRVKFAAKRAVVLLGEAPRICRSRAGRGAAREAQEREACHYEIDRPCHLEFCAARLVDSKATLRVTSRLDRLCSRKRRLAIFAALFFLLLAVLKRTKLLKSPSSLGARVVKLPADKFE